jgi:hypothetical protein
MATLAPKKNKQSGDSDIGSMFMILVIIFMFIIWFSWYLDVRRKSWHNNDQNKLIIEG